MAIREWGRAIGWGLALCSTVAWSGCKEEDSDGGGQAQCIANQTIQCACPDGTAGVAVCTLEGTPGMCMCMPAAGAMAGAGGASGAGTAGASGAAGMMMVGGAGGTMAGGTGGMMAGGTGGMMSGGTGGMMAGGTGGMMSGGTGGTGEEVPAGATCEAAANWDPAWAEFEEEVLRLTNEARAAGHNCDSKGSFGAADPLTMNPILRCSSRLHSQDMGEKDYFEHTAPDGRDPFERMADAGYMGFTMGENIAKGQQSPQEVVDGWLESDGHCANIMNPNFTEIGVGYWEGEADNTFFNDNKLWTQNFGAPLGGGGRN